MPVMTFSTRSALAAGIALAAMLVAGGALFERPALAELVDPALAQRRVIGAPAGHAPMHRVDTTRSGRAKQTLPRRPRVLWRARLPGGIEHPVSVDERGSLLVAGAPGQLTELDARGKVRSTVRLGSAAACPPVLTSDGTRMIVNAGGELVAIDSAGRVRFRRALPVAFVRGAAPPLPLDDGGLVVAVGGAVLRLEPNGDVRERADVGGEVKSLLARNGASLIATERGDVFEWKPPAAPTKLGTFGGNVDGAALCGNGRLCGIVDGERLIELKLASGARHVRVPGAALVLRGPPALLANGETRVVSADGLLLGHDATGKELLRVALEPTRAGGDAGTPLPPSQLAAPPTIVDAEGRSGFVRPWLEAGTVSADGEVALASGASCGDPIDVAPAGRGRMVVACRSGLLWMLSD
jgi:hypothetical protein